MVTVGAVVALATLWVLRDLVVRLLADRVDARKGVSEATTTRLGELEERVGKVEEASRQHQAALNKSMRGVRN